MEEEVSPVTKEPLQFKPGEVFCIFRERDLLRNQEHLALVKDTSGILSRIKRKLSSLFTPGESALLLFLWRILI